MPTLNSQSEEDGFDALDRALKWESGGRRPWRSYGASSALHALALVLSSVFIRLVALSVPDSQRTILTTIDFEPGEVYAVPQRPTARAILTSLQRGSSETADATVHEQPEVRVDLGTVRITFAADSRHQLPQVVEDQQGMLALLDRKDTTIAHYLVQPPDWAAHEGVEDISRNLRVFMDPPEEWAVFRKLAIDQGINLSLYQASALFDDTFRHCLKNAIISKASSQPGRSGNVLSARLAVVASQPCGIEVLEVSFAAH
jgi:hypothetical protein